MKNFKERYHRWIFDSFSVSPEGMGLYRIFVAVFILGFILPDIEMYEFLGTVPNELFSPPPGPMWFFEGFPSESVFLLLHSLLIVSLVCLLVGFRTKWASILAGVLLLAIKGFFYSIGKINHDLLLSVLPIVMSFSGWGKAYSIDGWLHRGDKEFQRVEGWPLSLLALFLGFMMFTAGFPKLLGGWLELDTQATLGHFFKQFFVKGRQDLLATYIINIDNRIIWELLDYATVLFEMGFLVAIIHPRSTRLFVSFAVLFHFSIMMTLNISFLPNFPAYAAFLNWSAINDRFKKWLDVKLASPIILVGIFLIFGFFYQVGSAFKIPRLESDLTIHEFYILVLALPIALYFLGQQALIFYNQLKN